MQECINYLLFDLFSSAKQDLSSEGFDDDILDGESVFHKVQTLIWIMIII